jgi:uncharacterized protein YxjI
MGFLEKMVAKIATEKIKTSTMRGVVGYMNDTYSVNALVNKSTANHMLFIKKKSMSIKRGFTVYDKLDNKKYVVKTEALTFGYPCIRLYDTEDCEIGKVELTSKKSMGTYSMILDGKTLGTITRKMSVKIKLTLSFNGWHLDSDFFQNNFIVTDRSGNRVMEFSKAYSAQDTYVLEMNSKEHEIIGLLLVMAVEIILQNQ